MSKIKEAFKNGKAFIPFITGGDPDLETTKKLIIEMQNAGADIIEVGIPFFRPNRRRTGYSEGRFKIIGSRLYNR